MSHRPDDPFTGAEDEEDRVDLDDLFGRREAKSERRPRGRVPEFVRRAIENTVGSVPSTGTLSREALEYLDKGRREVLRIVASEVGDFLRNTDLSREVVKILSSLQVEVNASLRFRPVGEARATSTSTSAARPPAEGEAQAAAPERPERSDRPSRAPEVVPEPNIQVSVGLSEKEPPRRPSEPASRGPEGE
ncbi:MAG: hypothetical protein IT384_19900 [Deltaproteobacteria bacterium]|nr:hypothetical protein [Deltaproteobacteria bacterium]